MLFTYRPYRKIMERLLKLITAKTPCYFISPHLDDAVLSAGSLIYRLRKKHVPVTIINVFTKVDSHTPTLSARQFLRQCGYRDPQKLFRDRISEDETTLRAIGCRVINLDFIDSSWRKKEKLNPVSQWLGPLIPELIHIYPTYRWHVIRGKISENDYSLMDKIGRRLRQIISPGKNYVFSPLGNGNHVDHVIVHKVSSLIFPKTIFWSDFPYLLTSSDKDSRFSDYKKYEFPVRSENKNKLIKGYKSQVRAIFKDGHIPQMKEIYYLSRNNRYVS